MMHKTVDDVANSIVKQLKEFKGDVWKQYVGDVQIQHSLIYNELEKLVDELISANTEKLSIFELAKLFDDSFLGASNRDVFTVIDDFWNKENTKVGDMLLSLEFELRNCVNEGIRSAVWTIAADTDMDTLG